MPRPDAKRFALLTLLANVSKVAFGLAPHGRWR